jgi:hypothetical protein
MQRICDCEKGNRLFFGLGLVEDVPAAAAALFFGLGLVEDVAAAAAAATSGVAAASGDAAITGTARIGETIAVSAGHLRSARSTGRRKVLQAVMRSSRNIGIASSRSIRPDRHRSKKPTQARPLCPTTIRHSLMLLVMKTSASNNVFKRLSSKVLCSKVAVKVTVLRSARPLPTIAAAARLRHLAAQPAQEKCRSRRPRRHSRLR